MEVDSNHRSRRRQIYSLLPLAARESLHIKLVELVMGLEPATCWLQISCSANWATPARSGALGRNRTTDTGIFSPLLYRLSYQGISNCLQFWWAFRDSNPGPIGYEPTALTSWAKSPNFLVTPTGIEPVLPPWKGDVLTAWPRRHAANNPFNKMLPIQTNFRLLDNYT